MILVFGLYLMHALYLGNFLPKMTNLPEKWYAIPALISGINNPCWQLTQPGMHKKRGSLSKAPFFMHFRY